MYSHNHIHTHTLLSVVLNFTKNLSLSLSFIHGQLSDIFIMIFLSFFSISNLILHVS